MSAFQTMIWCFTDLHFALSAGPTKDNRFFEDYGVYIDDPYLVDLTTRLQKAETLAYKKANRFFEHYPRTYESYIHMILDEDYFCLFRNLSLDPSWHIRYEDEDTNYLDPDVDIAFSPFKYFRTMCKYHLNAYIEDLTLGKESDFFYGSGGYIPELAALSDEEKNNLLAEINSHFVKLTHRQVRDLLSAITIDDERVHCRYACDILYKYFGHIFTFDKVTWDKDYFLPKHLRSANN